MSHCRFDPRNKLAPGGGNKPDRQTQTDTDTPGRNEGREGEREGRGGRREGGGRGGRKRQKEEEMDG